MKTRAEYLESRGWTVDDEDDDGRPCAFADPQRPSVVPAYGGGNMKITFSPSDAETIQRARDAAEERAAWVRFAAARASIGQLQSPVTIQHTRERPGSYDHDAAAGSADDLLAEYRARFAAPDRYDRAAIDRARRGAYAVPLAHVLARPNERGDLHLDQMHAPQPWREVLLMILAAVVCYLAIVGVGALVAP